MTVKEASEKFNISREEIRKLCRESQNSIVKYVKANKNVYWDIDDDTKSNNDKRTNIAFTVTIIKI